MVDNGGEKLYGMEWPPPSTHSKALMAYYCSEGKSNFKKEKKGENLSFFVFPRPSFAFNNVEGRSGPIANHFLTHMNHVRRSKIYLGSPPDLVHVWMAVFRVHGSFNI